MKTNVGEKLTDEEADSMIKETEERVLQIAEAVFFRSGRKQWRLITLNWNVYVERVVGQIVGVPVVQVVEKIIEVPKITQQVEYTQHQMQIVSRQDPAANR